MYPREPLDKKKKSYFKKDITYKTLYKQPKKHHAYRSSSASILPSPMHAWMIYEQANPSFVENSSSPAEWFALVVVAAAIRWLNRTTQQSGRTEKYIPLSARTRTSNTSALLLAHHRRHPLSSRPSPGPTRCCCILEPCRPLSNVK